MEDRRGSFALHLCWSQPHSTYSNAVGVVSNLKREQT